MSECVVRMEMPNGCHDCKLRNMVGNCPIPMFDGPDEKKIWTLAECFQRPPWCPIICQLPEGHGRLVDADRVSLAMVERGQRSSRGKLGEMWELNGPEIREALQTVSTIVPAEVESPSPKPTDPLPIRGVEYVPTEVDVKTGTVTYELRERTET